MTSVAARSFMISWGTFAFYVHLVCWLLGRPARDQSGGRVWTPLLLSSLSNTSLPLSWATDLLGSSVLRWFAGLGAAAGEQNRRSVCSLEDAHRRNSEPDCCW